MTVLAQLGKKRTLLISISILIVSLHTIYYYHSVRPEIESKKLVQQIIRFVLTVALLVFLYKGKNWAKILSTVLFALGAIGAIIAVVIIDAPFAGKIPLLVMTFVYSVAVYHFGFSESYKAFFHHQNKVSEL